MSANVGKIDRAVRTLLGLALVVWAFVGQAPMWDNAFIMWGTIIVGAVLIVTASMKFCPMYRILGVSTCPR